MITKHMGPGDHPSGSAQDVHGSALETAIGILQRDGVKTRVPFTDESGKSVAISMIPLSESTQAKIEDRLETLGSSLSEGTDNLMAVATSALERYEMMNLQGDWQDSDYPNWVDMPLYADVRDQIIEVSGATWRWRPGAGDALQQHDAFYERTHEKLAAASAAFGVPMSEMVGVYAAISPGMESTTNLSNAVTMYELWAENPALTPEMTDLLTGILEAAREKKIEEADSAKTEKSRKYRLSLAAELDHEVAPGTRLRDMPNASVTTYAAQVYRQATMGTGFDVTVGYQNYHKAWKIIRQESDADGALDGLKVRSFFNNTIDPASSLDITVDFQTIHAYLDQVLPMRDKRPYGIVERGIDWGILPAVADSIRTVASSEVGESLGVTVPSQLQEIVWMEWKRLKDD